MNVGTRVPSQFGRLGERLEIRDEQTEMRAEAALLVVVEQAHGHKKTPPAGIRVGVISPVGAVRGELHRLEWKIALERAIIFPPHPCLGSPLPKSAPPRVSMPPTCSGSAGCWRSSRSSSRPST